MLNRSIHQTIDLNFTLKNGLLFSIIALILYQGQISAISKLNDLVGVKGEFIFPVALPIQAFSPRQGGSPQSMVDQDPATWFYHNLAWGNGFIVNLAEAINLNYLEINTDEHRKPTGMDIYISKGVEWIHVEKIQNIQNNHIRVPIESNADRIKLEFLGTTSKDTLIRINELTLMADAQAEPDYWNIYFSSIIVLVLVNAGSVVLRRWRNRISFSILLIAIIAFYGFKRMEMDISNKVAVDYETGYQNTPSSGLFEGRLFNGFDHSNSSGVLLNLQSPGYIDYKFPNLPNLSHSKLKSIVVQTDKDRPPVEILVVLDNGLKKRIEGQSHPNWVEFPINLPLNLAQQVRIRFLKGPMDAYVRVNEIKLYLDMPAYGYVEHLLTELVKTAFTRPYYLYTISLLLYLYIIFSRKSRLVDFKRGIKKNISIFLEGASYFWYSLGIVFFLIYLFIVREHNLLWSQSRYQLKYILDVRPEIQIAVLFIFIALIAQLFLWAFKNQYLDLSAVLSFRSLITHILTLGLFFLLLHVHFFIYINIDRFIPFELAPAPSSKETYPNFGKEPRIERLFDGDDGTFHPPTKNLFIQWAYGKNKWLLGNPNFRWIWVSHARHEAFWDRDLYAEIGGNVNIGGIKAERDFSLNYLKVTVPENWNGNKIKFKRFSLTHAEISEIYFVGSHFYQIVFLYFGTFGLILFGVNKFNELGLSPYNPVDRKIRK